MQITDIVFDYCQERKLPVVWDTDENGISTCTGRCSKLRHCSQLTRMVAVTQLGTPVSGQGKDDEAAALDVYARLEPTLLAGTRT